MKGKNPTFYFQTNETTPTKEHRLLKKDGGVLKKRRGVRSKTSGRFKKTLGRRKFIWGDDSFFNSGSLHAYITKLRHKLSKDERIRLVNVQGKGTLMCVASGQTAGANDGGVTKHPKGWILMLHPDLL